MVTNHVVSFMQLLSSTWDTLKPTVLCIYIYVPYIYILHIPCILYIHIYILLENTNSVVPCTSSQATFKYIYIFSFSCLCHASPSPWPPFVFLLCLKYLGQKLLAANLLSRKAVLQRAFFCQESSRHWKSHFVNSFSPSFKNKGSFVKNQGWRIYQVWYKWPLNSLASSFVRCSSSSLLLISANFFW